MMAYLIPLPITTLNDLSSRPAAAFVATLLLESVLDHHLHGEVGADFEHLELAIPQVSLCSNHTPK